MMLSPLSDGRLLSFCRSTTAGSRGLQTQLGAFREVYNEQRPHRAIGRRTPAKRTGRRRRCCRPGAAPRVTSASATTSPTARAHDPASGRPPLPPQGRRGPCPPAGPGHHGPDGGHGRGPRHRRDPLDPPDRSRQGLLAQHATRPRPMAGVSTDRVITCVADDSRLMTMAGEEDFESTDREVLVVAAVPRCRIGEGSCPPPRAVALDGETPPRERAVQGGGDDDCSSSGSSLRG